MQRRLSSSSAGDSAARMPASSGAGRSAAAAGRVVRGVHGVAGTQAFAREVAKTFGPGAFYALEGDLGAGKTCFVQGLCDGLGIRAAVSSPTFAIANEYRDESSGRRFLHLDLYRLSGPDELDTIGWDDYLDSGDTMAVEWPERAAGRLPPGAIRVCIRPGREPDDRVIEVDSPQGRFRGTSAKAG